MANQQQSPPINTALELQPAAPVSEYVEQNIPAMQQAATARIQSVYVMASRTPRNIEVIRQDVLRECQRPSFCAPDESKSGSSLAIYRVPRGSIQVNGKGEKQFIQGPTIRFAEMMLRAYRYLSIEVNPMGEDAEQRLLQVILTDYQACNWTSEIVTVPKRVERKKTKPDDVIIGQRTNSYGDTVFIVQATDDELAMKTNALVSKARRNLILQAVPGWLIEEGVDMVRRTAATKDAEDPDAAKRKIFDAFAQVGVSAAHLGEYLGHSNALSPAELEDLRGLYSGIREGFTTWGAIMAAKNEQGDDDGTGEAIEEAFKALEMPVARVRKLKGQYAGKPKELLAWLQGEVAKKQNDGGKPVANPTNGAGTPSTQTQQDSVNTSPSTPSQDTGKTAENPDAEPPDPPQSVEDRVAQSSAPKPSPAAGPKKSPPPPPATSGGW